MKKLPWMAVFAAGVVAGCTPEKPTELTYQGHPREEWMQIFSPDTNSAEGPLKITQIIDNSESRVVTVEVALSYDSLKQHGLSWDYTEFLLEVNGYDKSTWCRRATNGNCLFFFDRNDLRPGMNRIQVCVLICDLTNVLAVLEIRGPSTPFVSSNICHINPYLGSTHFKGIILHADLAEPNAIYSISLQTPAGDHIKTFTGTISNGVIDERWDLKDEHGDTYTNSSVNAVYHVMLTNSLSETKTQAYSIQPH